MKVMCVLLFTTFLIFIVEHAIACPPIVGGCSVFSKDDEWNRDVTNDPVSFMSNCYIAAQFTGNNIRLDFGSTEPEYGIPFTLVNRNTPLATITYGVEGEDYEDESDPGPFPIPLNAPIEGNGGLGDRHVIAIDTDSCMLFETYKTVRTANGFACGSSAKFNLSATNYRRTAGWTSADAAGLPIFPGLLRYEEAATGTISHAIRFTVPSAAAAYTYPGNHFGPNQNVAFPPYGTRFRLKATFDETPYTGPSLAIVRALKKYGMIFADQGSAIYLTGVTNPGWASTISRINQQSRIPGDQFEALQSPFPIVRGWNPGSTLQCQGRTAETNPNWQPQQNTEICTGATQQTSATQNPPSSQRATTQNQPTQGGTTQRATTQNQPTQGGTSASQSNVQTSAIPQTTEIAGSDIASAGALIGLSSVLLLAVAFI